MRYQALKSLVILLLVQSLGAATCRRGGSPGEYIPGKEVNWWLTTADSTRLLVPQEGIRFANSTGSLPAIELKPDVQYQTVDGFGYTLTGGSAQLIGKLSPAQRSSLLQELFGRREQDLKISYLRISIGASDLDSAVFSYNDLPPGQADPNLDSFSLKADRRYLIPLLKEILAIRPELKIMGSPWSPPAWMKDNGNTVGGSLKPEYYEVYARYFVKYLAAMKAEGIELDAITPQNEPLHPGNNPSMYMTAVQQADFIKNHLGPAFQKAGLATKIVIYDHNADRPDYPLTVLGDPDARKYIHGTAFHLYAGDVSALSQVHQAYPDKAIYFTEQWTGAKGEFGGDLKWHIKNVIIGTMRNWSRVALEWNLANDPSFKPHTPGGCTECKGALTIGNGINRNVSYYIVAHASRFVPAGSVRLESSGPADLPNVLFKTPEGKLVLIVLNERNARQSFRVKLNNSAFTAELPDGGVATFVW